MPKVPHIDTTSRLAGMKSKEAERGQGGSIATMQQRPATVVIMTSHLLFCTQQLQKLHQNCDLAVITIHWVCARLYAYPP